MSLQKKGGLRMGTVTKLVSVTGAMILLSSGVAFGQAQSKNQQGCVNALNKDGAKVGATQGKENTSCIKNAGKGKESNPQACLTADSKGKVAKAASKISADFDKKCTAETPTTGVPGVFSGTAAAVADAGQDDEVQFVADVFGNDARHRHPHRQGRFEVPGHGEQGLGEDLRDVHEGLSEVQEGGAEGGQLSGCLRARRWRQGGQDGEQASGGHRQEMRQYSRCRSFAPGLCSGSSTGDLADCIAERVRVPRRARSQNRMDGLHVNCDALDDGSRERQLCRRPTGQAATFAEGSGFPLL